MRFAVLDLGSSSFHLLVADATPGGAITPILRERVFLNLGLQLVGEGRIARTSAAKAVQTVSRFRELARRTGADRTIPVATSALRDASNRSELDEALREAAGAPVRFVDGIEEARLAFLGVTASVALSEPSIVALDLGGGSLEVAAGDHASFRWAATLPLGAARVSTMWVHDPPSRGERRSLEAAVREALAPWVDRIDAGATSFVVCGGTARALARIDAVDRWGIVPPSVNQQGLSSVRLRELAGTLAGKAHDARARIPGMDARRVDLLPAGATVLSTALSALRADGAVVSEWGLREGIILDALGLADRPVPSPSALRERSIDQLRAGWIGDDPHGETVSVTAARLFDATADLHGLGSRERELLVHAGRIHEVGVRVAADRFHKHGAYLVEHAALRGFPPDDVAMLASIVRFQRGGDPRTSYEPFDRLAEDDRRRCTTLTALFRVAHGLARLDGAKVPTIRAEGGRDALRIWVSDAEDPGAVVAEAGAHTGPLSARLGIDVRVLADNTLSEDTVSA